MQDEEKQIAAISGPRVHLASHIVVSDGEYVIVKGCRHVLVEGCDDVKVAHTSGLSTAGHNVWGGSANLVVTEGDVTSRLKGDDS